MDAGVAGVVAMAYNVYVVTAAQFIGNVYASLLEGRQLGQAVTAARRQLAAAPAAPGRLAAAAVAGLAGAGGVRGRPPHPARCRPAQEQPELTVSLDQAEAGRERASLDPGLPAGPGCRVLRPR